MAHSTAVTPPAYCVEWENGVSMGTVRTGSKSESFAFIDSQLKASAYPDSLFLVITENGKAVWAQHGTLVTLNV